MPIVWGRRRQEIDLGFTKIDKHTEFKPSTAVLRLETIQTWNDKVFFAAEVHWKGDSRFSHSLGQDFDKQIKKPQSMPWLDQSEIDHIHDEVFTNELVESLIEQAKAHYARGKTQSRIVISKFKVTAATAGWVSAVFEVEAKNEEEAKDRAKEMNMDDPDLIWNVDSLFEETEIDFRIEKV